MKITENRKKYLNNLLLLISSLSKTNFNEFTKRLILESYKDGYKLGLKQGREYYEKNI